MTRIGVVKFFCTLILGFAVGLYWRTIVPPKHHLPPKDPQERGRHFHEQFSSQFGLNEEQKEAADKIFESKRVKVEALREEVFPQFEALRKEMHKEILAILDEEQKSKFEAFHQEREQKRREHFGPDPKGKHHPPPHHENGMPPPPPPHHGDGMPPPRPDFPPPPHGD